MRITHLVCTDSFAGVERHVAVLAAAQHDDGHDVTVLGGDQARMRAAIDRPGVLLRPVTDVVGAVRQLAGPAGRRADVVATHMTQADLAALISPGPARTAIVSTRHFARRRGATPSPRLVAERLQSRLGAEIAVSQYIAGAIDVDATVVLPGIHDRPAGLPPSQREQTVLVVQRLEDEKATDVAVRAFAASGLAGRGWRLVVAGDGARRADLGELASRLGIAPTTDFLGHRGDIDELMMRHGMLLAPCPVEGLGLAVVEAMASGLPVVAAAAGGHLETAGAVPGAALFTPGDVEQAAAQLADLAADPARRDRLGHDLRERQQQTFSIAAQAAATEQVYRHAVAATRGDLPARRPGPGRDLVVVSLEPWDRVWRRNQHLLAGLLEQDPTLRILLVEPGTDPLHAVRIGERPRPGRGLRRGPHLPGVDPDAVWLLEPTKLLPRRVDHDQDARWARQVEDAAHRLGFTHPTLWVNDPRGAHVMERTGWPTLYDITDDWLQADRDAATLRRLTEQEESLMAGAREVVVCSRSLVATKSAHRPVTLLHNAVDAAAIGRPTARPADLPTGPVAVYVGTLHSDRLDVDLCVETAQRLAGSGRLVLVGPDALTGAERERLDAAGVERLGARDRRLVPAYLQHADVLVVPHVVDDFTDSLDPIKLYEYRAVGRSVVSTRVAGFREAGGDRLTVCAREDFASEVAARVPATDRYPTGVDLTVPTWADRVSEMQHVLERVAAGPSGGFGDGAATGEPGVVEVPVDIRVRFGHAAVQHLADLHGLDVLHIKGHALDERLRHPGRLATDADVVVRPDHVARLLEVCEAHGHVVTGRFATGSPFEHSTTLWHPHWGYTDVHRRYPGIGLPPAEAFDRMWTARTEQDIADTPCPTPSLAAQVAVLVLHAGRSVHGGQATRDVQFAWHGAPPDLQAEVRRWVTDMRAEVGFAAGLGQLGSLPDSPEKQLWLAVTREGRVREWRARIAAAPDPLTRTRLLLRAPLVNTDHLAKQLGRRPTRAEVASAFVDRLVRGAAELTGWGGRGR
ncbi:glycosyltransferase [Janibacter anophelis]|uniref:glycosyltransferase n=1 Tax=Janibacter anophelis TaxID=319054 RepID=UPI003F7D91A0